MYDLRTFSIKDMTQCGIALRQAGKDGRDLSDVSERIVRHLYENLCERDTERRSCALVRLFRTQRYVTLDADTRLFADRMMGHLTEAGNIPPDLRCLVLCATAGDKPEWNDVKRSKGHRAIPLESERMVEQAPMIANLIRQLGLDVRTVLSPDPKFLIDMDQRTFNVFFVPDAVGSPHIPAQEGFVLRAGIRSVLGFGGLLPSGDLFATILFSKTPIPKGTADLFKTLALSARIAVLPFVLQAGATDHRE